MQNFPESRATLDLWPIYTNSELQDPVFLVG